MRTSNLSRQLCLITALVLLSAASAFSQNRSSISGFVFDTNRRPVGNQPVELMNDVGYVLTRTRSDASGRYYFGGLSSGRFSVKVLSMGSNLQEQTQDAEIAGVGVTGRSLADNIQLDFYMKLRSVNSGRAPINEVVYVQDVPQDARNAYKEGVDDLNSSRLDAGIAELEKSLAIFPTYFDALSRLGTIRLGQQKFEEAAKLFDRAVKVNDKSFSSWYGLSYASIALKDAKTAAAAAEKASVLNTDSVESFLLLGIALRQIKEYSKAETALKQAEKVGKGKFPDVHWNLALLYAHNLKKFNEAADQLERFLKESPDATNKDMVKKLIKQLREKSTATS